MRHTLLLVLLFTYTVLPRLVQGQNIKASPTGDACPNKTYTYTLGAACNNYNWTVAGGKITRGQGTSSIDVVWNDVPTNKSTTPYSTNLQVAVSGCASATTIQPYNVFVSSISDQTPGPLSVNGTTVSNGHYALPFGDNMALTLKVPLVELPQSAPGVYS